MPPKGGRSSRPKSGAAKVEGVEQVSVCSWPAWDDDDIAAEKFDDNSKSKEKIKWPFDHPDGQVALPTDVGTASAWLRPSELFKKPEPVASEDGEDQEADPQPVIEPCVVSRIRFNREPVPVHLTEAEKLWYRRKQLKQPDLTEEPHVSLVTTNSHLIGSEAIRHIIAHLSWMQREGSASDPLSERPWELIYPQDADHIPQYNPCGKYCVKLFWLGRWRKVVVDDTVPVDGEGRALLPTTSLAGELWTILLSKALLRVGSLGYKEDYGMSRYMEMITSWSPWRAFMTTSTDTALAITMKQTITPPLPPPKPLPIDPPAPEPVEEEPDAGRKQSSKPRKGKSAVEKKPKSPKKAASTVPQGPYARLPPSAAILVTADLKSGDEEADGMSQKLSHPMRVLACECVARDQASSNAHDWVVRLESPFSLYTGPLGHGNSAAWSRSIRAALGVSPDREELLQGVAVQAHEAGVPHAAFTFHMHYDRFCELFGNVQIHLKSNSRLNNVVVERIQVGSLRALLLFTLAQGAQTIPVYPKPSANLPETMTNSPLDAGRPLWLFADSISPSRILFNLSVAPHHCISGANPLVESNEAAAAAEEGCASEESDKGDQTTGTLGTTSSSTVPKGALVVEEYCWSQVANGNVVLQMTSTGSTAAELTVPAGRRVYRLFLDAPHSYSLRVSSDKEIRVGPETYLLPLLQTHSALFQDHAVTTCRAVNILMQGDDASDQLLTKLCMEHISLGLGQEQMQAFWESFQWALETTLADEWKDKSGNDTALATAWVSTVDNLRERTRHTMAMQIPVEADAELEHTAARVIQDAWRSTLRRRLASVTAEVVLRSLLLMLHARLTGQQLLKRKAVNSSWEKLNKSLSDFSEVVLSRLLELQPQTMNLFSFSVDNKHRALRSEFEGTLDVQQPGQFVSQRITLAVPETATVSLRMVATTSDGNIVSNLKLTLYDPQTAEQVPSLLGQPMVTKLEGGPNPYSLIICGCPGVVGSVSYTIRTLASPTLPTLTLAEVHTATASAECNFRDPATSCLFRYLLTASKSATIALTTSEPDAILTLEVEHEDGRSAQTAGFGNVIFPLHHIEPRVVPPPEPEPTPEGQDADADTKDSDKPEELAETAEPTIEPVTIALVGFLRGPVVKRIQDQKAKDAERSQQSSASGKKDSKKDKKRSKSAIKTTPLPTFTISVCSEAELTLKNDDAREIEVQSLKAAWEAAEPGRKQKAEQLRSKFLSEANPEEQEQPQASALIIQEGEGNPKVLDEQAKQKRQEEHNQRVKAYKTSREATKRIREEQCLARKEQKEAQRDALMSLHSQKLAATQPHLDKREAYRQSVLAAIAAANPVEEPAEPEPVKKGKGKKK